MNVKYNAIWAVEINGGSEETCRHHLQGLMRSQAISVEGICIRYKILLKRELTKISLGFRVVDITNQLLELGS